MGAAGAEGGSEEEGGRGEAGARVGVGWEAASWEGEEQAQEG